MSESDRP